MTRAALAYGAGWVGCVVVSGDAPPLALLHTESFELGHVVKREGELVTKRGSWDSERLVSAEDVSVVAQRVLTLVAGHMADRCVVGVPHGAMAAHLREVASLVEAAGIAVEYVDAPENNRAVARDLPRIVAGIPSWPANQGAAAGDSGACRRAAGLLVPAPAHEDGPAADEGIEGRPTVDGASPLPVARPADRAQPSLTLADIEAPQGVRRAFIDPGDASVGVVVAEGDALPLRKIVAHTLEIGERVPLRKPIVKTREDGSTYTKTYTRALGAEHIDTVCDEIEAVLRVLGVEEVWVEWAPHVYASNKSQGAGGAKARSSRVTRTQFIGGDIRGQLRRAGFRVGVVLRSSWSARATGKRRVRNADVAAAVAAGFSNWAEIGARAHLGSDAHERDAAGMAIWRVLQKPKKLPGARKTPGRPGNRAPTCAAKTAERRETAGCGCGSKRHRRACPLSKPLMQWGWAETKMIEEHWKSTLEIRREAMRTGGDNDRWNSLSPARRDAITRARAVLLDFDIWTPFELCQVCQLPCRDNSGQLPPSQITCRCHARRAA